MSKGSLRPGTGFTLIEVLMVVAIIAIAGAVVVPQMLQAGTFHSQAAARVVIADLLYAQNDAIAAQAPRRIVFEPNLNRYRLTDEQGTTLTANWMSGGDAGANYLVDFAADRRFSGVQITLADFADTTTLEFDDLGAPSSGGSVELTSLTSTNVQYRINVAPFTGRVTIESVTP